MASPPPNPSDKFTALKARWRERFTSPWATVLGRVSFVGLALAVFIVIGRSTFAQGAAREGVAPTPFSMKRVVASSDTDGGVGASSAQSVPSTSEAANSSTTLGLSSGARIILNEATSDELQRLPGIGPKRALAVVELRKRLGQFKKIEDLLRVKGIGRNLLKALRPLIQLDALPKIDAGAPM